MASKRRWKLLVAVAITAGCAAVVATCPAIQSTARRASEPTGDLSDPRAGTVRADRVEDACVAHGRVRGASGRGVRARLVLFGADDGHVRTASTDARGAWRIENVPRGAAHVLLASSEHGEAGSARLAEPCLPIEIELSDDGVMLRGEVTDEHGMPIAGAVVGVAPRDLAVAAAMPGGGIGTVADDAGRFALRVPEGDLEMAAWHWSYAPGRRLVRVSGEGARADIELVEGANIRGRVVDDEGVGVGGASVTATPDRSDPRWSRPDVALASWMPRPPPHTVVSEADGSFALGGLPPGATRLSASTDLLRSHDAHLDLVAGRDVADLELVLVADLSLKGTVVGVRADDDASGLRVRAQDAAGHGHAALTDEAGRFRIRGLSPGTYEVNVSWADQPGGSLAQATVDLSHDTAPVELVVAELAPRGVAVRGDLRPPAAGVVMVRPAHEGVHAAALLRRSGEGVTWTAVGSDGRFALGGLPPGRVFLIARSADGRVGSTTLDVGDVPRDGIAIELEPGAVIEGTVRREGTPAEGMTVRVEAVTGRGGAGPVVSRQTGGGWIPTIADGSFRLAGLQPGSYAVTAYDTRGPVPDVAERASTVLELGSGSYQRIVIELPRSTGVIRGTLVEDDGRPASGVVLAAKRVVDGQPMARPDATAVVAEDGRFQLDELLPTARYELIANPGRRNETTLATLAPSESSQWLSLEPE
jgi:protocatechuate 3,4-dioxygenase beta subunit